MRNKSSRTQKVPNSLRLPWARGATPSGDLTFNQPRASSVHAGLSPGPHCRPYRGKNPSREGPSLSYGASTGQHTYHLGACKNAEYQASSQTHLTRNLHPMRSPESQSAHSCLRSISKPPSLFCLLLVGNFSHSHIYTCMYVYIYPLPPSLAVSWWRSIQVQDDENNAEKAKRCS